MQEELMALASKIGFKSLLETKDFVPIKSSMCYFYYLCELQKWLREKHRIHTTIISCMISSNEIKYYIFKGKLKWNWNELFNSYEDALEAGLFEALKLINNEDQKTI